MWNDVVQACRWYNLLGVFFVFCVFRAGGANDACVEFYPGPKSNQARMDKLGKGSAVKMVSERRNWRRNNRNNRLGQKGCMLTTRSKSKHYIATGVLCRMNDHSHREICTYVEFMLVIHLYYRLWYLPVV